MQEEHISQRIKTLLKEAGIKQAHLADKLGIHRQAVHRLLGSEISKSKYFSEIANVLGVSEEYLILGDKKGVLFVDDEYLKKLIANKFSLTAEDKDHMEYLAIHSKKACCFFANKLKFAIDHCLKAGSLIIYAAEVSEQKQEGEIFILLSAINQSFIVGRYSAKQGLEYLVNENGKYIVQESDMFVGIAVQIVIYLED